MSRGKCPAPVNRDCTSTFPRFGF